MWYEHKIIFEKYEKKGSCDLKRILKQICQELGVKKWIGFVWRSQIL
jgi:hypothetical protein